MKSFDSEFKKHVEKIHLKMSERRELRERILSYMEYHPLPKQQRAGLKEVPSAPFTFVRFFNVRVMQGVSAFAVLALIIVPFIAERAVPGDVLYLVKTNINESIEGTLADSPYEKIEFETRLMERRIAEARVLADEGRLTEEVKMQIAESVKDHSIAVQNGITQLRIEDAEGAAIAQIAYNSSLEVQSALLGTGEVAIAATMMSDAMGTDTVETLEAEATPPVDPILSAVNEARNAAAREEVGTPSFDGLMAHIETETTRAYELFQTVKKSATEEEVRDIERRLSDIHRTIEEAKEQRSSDETIAATDLTGTLKQIQKLILFMTNIDVRRTVSLESIVPVVLSDEERIALAKESLAGIDASRIDATEKISLIEDSTVVTEIETALASLDELMLSVSTTVAALEVEETESLLAEAQILMSDILNLVWTHVPMEDGVVDGVEEVEAVEEVIDTPPVDEEETPEVSEEGTDGGGHGGAYKEAGPGARRG